MTVKDSSEETTTVAPLQKKLRTLGIDHSLPSYESGDILANPLDIYRSFMANELTKILDCDRQLIYNAIQWSNQLSNGDLILIVPKLGLKGAKLAEVTKELSSKTSSSVLFEAPVAAGNQLQLRFSPSTLPKLLLPYIFERGSSYGCRPNLGFKDTPAPEQRKKIVIDFSSPDIAKEFHTGHLRSTIIGAFLANLYQNSGWDVVKVNYLGDWGKQFGLLAVDWQSFGSELEEILVKAARKRGEDTAQLESLGIYAERNDFFKRMEDGEPEALALWKRCRDISMERYIDVYARLNVSFDEYSGESQIKPDSIKKVEAILIERGIVKDDKNALVVDFKDHGAPNLGVSTIRNREGTSTYLLRDAAALIERAEKYQFDRTIYVVSSEQDAYFQRLFKIVELMGRQDLASKVQHVNFGLVSGMSSRSGNAELLEDVLYDCGDAMHDVMRSNPVKCAQVEDPEGVSDILGITAAMVQDMSGKRINNYPFDMNRMMSFEGDTGPHLQYTHARLCSILRKSGFTIAELTTADFSLLKEQPVIDSLRLMAQYPDVTHTAYKTLEPATILTYLFKFTHQLSSGYDVVKVVGIEDKEVSKARAAYCECARQVLSNGMTLLGIRPVQRM